MCDRTNGIKNVLDRAAKRYNNPDICNIPNGAYDRGEKYGVYSMCYNKHTPELERFCGPDFNFGGWPTANMPSFETTRDEIIAASSVPPTIDKVGWYGNIYSPLRDVPEYHTRPLLHKIGAQYSDIFDIVHVQVPLPNTPTYKTMADLTQYKYLIDIGGNGWSGRLKWLLFTRRPILLVDRNYIDFFYKDLQPYVHFIPVRMDLSDLMDQFMWMVNNPEQCTQIAENAFKFATENFTEEKLCERVLYVYNNIRAMSN